MAEAKQKKILSFKLGLLEEQRDRLSSVVSHRVNKVIQLGRSWLAGRKTDNKGKTLSFKDMSDLIEDTDLLLAQQLEQMPDEDQDAFNKETAGDTSTSSSHSTATASQTADTEMLKSALARIQNLEESLSSVKTNRELDAANIRRLQNKVRDLEKDKNRTFIKVEKELQEVTLKYQMVCQIVADRLLPLEKLREILNNKVKNSHENVQKLHTVIRDVADLVPKVSHLENQIQQKTTPTRAVHDKKLYTIIQDVADLVPKVSHLENQIQQTITPTMAVTAVVANIKPVRGNILDKWRCGAGNTGGHFDVNTGIFTAPVRGVYAVALWMYQKNEGNFGLYIKKTPPGRNPSMDNDDYVAGAVTDRHESTNWDFSMVNLCVGDKLYVCVRYVDKSPTLGSCKFSIFLVK